MKKYLLTLFACLLLLFSISNVALAEEEIVESPDLKIEINGKVSAYSSTPIIVNGSTLLPLREILVNIGVQNDGEHIIWNSDDRSVTVNKDSTKVKLYVDNLTGYVNDKEITLSAAPVIYKDRTYIPARFVSQSMGMEVGWDGGLKKVFIKDKAEFNKVKDTLDKAYSAMKNLDKYKLNLKLDSIVTKDGLTSGVKSDSTVLIDQKKRIAQFDILFTMLVPNTVSNLSTKVEMFYDNNTSYMKNPVTQKWTKGTVAASESGEVWDNFSFAKNNIQLLSTALSFDTSAKADEIILKGNVNLSNFNKSALQNVDISKFKIDKSELIITINKNTNYISEIDLKVTISHESEGKVEVDVIQKSNDLNGNFEITLPKDMNIQTE